MTNLQEIRSELLELLRKADEINKNLDSIRVSVHFRSHKSKRTKRLINVIDFTVNQDDKEIHSILAYANEERMDREEIKQMFEVLEEIAVKG